MGTNVAAGRMKETNVLELSTRKRPVGLGVVDRGRSNTGVRKSPCSEAVVAMAAECLREEAAAVATLATRLDADFGRAVNAMLHCDGHVIISGLGKSGLVGRKIAATLASTGTPSFFVHSTEALHGDLGMVTSSDIAVLISYSGKTPEVVAMMRNLASRGVPTIAIVGRPDSVLGREASITLDASVDREACPNGLAPTSSTLAALALGDALAVSLMKVRGFQSSDFAKLHPGGSLGKQLSNVGEATVREGVTVLSPDESVSEALLALASTDLPLALVCEGTTLLGVFSAADVRAAGPCMDRPVSEVLNRHPRMVLATLRIAEADRALEAEGVGAAVTVDPSGEVLGIYCPRRR